MARMGKGSNRVEAPGSKGKESRSLAKELGLAFFFFFFF